MAPAQIGENFTEKTSTSVTDIIIHKAGNFFYGASSLVVMKSGFWNLCRLLPAFFIDLFESDFKALHNTARRQTTQGNIHGTF